MVEHNGFKPSSRPRAQTATEAPSLMFSLNFVDSAISRFWTETSGEITTRMFVPSSKDVKGMIASAFP